MNEGIGMPSPISLSLLCIVSIAASDGGPEVCNSLAAGRSDVAPLPRSIPVAHRDLKGTFDDVWAKLACA